MPGPSYMLASNKSCAPKSKTGDPAPAASKTYKEGDYRHCDKVTQMKIWTETVDSEQRCRKNWQHDWGFLTEYDARGNLKPKEELPDKVALFSENVPNTNGANYGNRIGTEVGQRMQKMEFQFYSGQRRKKMDNDLLCY